MRSIFRAAILISMLQSNCFAVEYHKYEIIFSYNDNACIRINNYLNRDVNNVAVVKKYDLKGFTKDNLVRIDIDNDNVIEFVHKNNHGLFGHFTQSIDVFRDNNKAIECIKSNYESNICKDVLLGVIPSDTVILNKLPIQRESHQPYLEIDPFIVVEILNIDGQNYIKLVEDNYQFKIRGDNIIVIRKYDSKLQYQDICYIFDRLLIK